MLISIKMVHQRCFSFVTIFLWYKDCSCIKLPCFSERRQCLQESSVWRRAHVVSLATQGYCQYPSAASAGVLAPRDRGPGPKMLPRSARVTWRGCVRSSLLCSESQDQPAPRFLPVRYPAPRGNQPHPVLPTHPFALPFAGDNNVATPWLRL